jgi:hypothetical protein
MKSKNALLVAGILALSPLPSSAADSFTPKGEPYLMAPFKSIAVPGGFKNTITFPLPTAGIKFYCPNDGTPATAVVS